MLTDLRPPPTSAPPSSATIDDQLRQNWRRQLEGEWQATWARLDHEAAPPAVSETEANAALPNQPVVSETRHVAARQHGDHAMARAATRLPVNGATAPSYPVQNTLSGEPADRPISPSVIAQGRWQSQETQSDSSLAGFDSRPSPPQGLTEASLSTRLVSAAEAEPGDSMEVRTNTRFLASAEAEREDGFAPQPLFCIREMESDAITASLRDANLSPAASADVARSLSYALMRMGYSQSQVYVNGAESGKRRADHDPSTQFHPLISQKETSHGD